MALFYILCVIMLAEKTKDENNRNQIQSQLKLLYVCRNKHKTIHSELGQFWGFIAPSSDISFSLHRHTEIEVKLIKKGLLKHEHRFSSKQANALPPPQITPQPSLFLFLHPSSEATPVVWATACCCRSTVLPGNQQMSTHTWMNPSSSWTN